MEAPAHVAADLFVPADNEERARIRLILGFGIILNVAVLLTRLLWPPSSVHTVAVGVHVVILFVFGVCLAALPQRNEQARQALEAAVLVAMIGTAIGYYASVLHNVPPRPNVTVNGGILLAVAIAVELSVRQQAFLAIAGTALSSLAVFLAPHRSPEYEFYSVVVTAAVCWGSVLARSWLRSRAHHEASRALAAKERQLQEMVDSAMHAIVTIDHNAIVTEYNPRAAGLYGYSRTDVLGHRFDEFLPESARDEALAFVTSMLDGQRDTTFAATIVSRDRHGDPLELEVMLFTGVGDGSGRPCLHAFMRDVSELRRLVRSKDEMIAILSHELRTPLTSLQGFAELMTTREFPRPTQIRYLEIIRREAQRLTRLVNGLLELRRVEAARESVEIGPVDLASVAAEAVARVPLDLKQDRRIVVDIANELPKAATDPDATGRILDNLLSNACKYSHDGSRITVSIRPDKGRIAISVIDEGIGIPPEDIARLFDEFFRGSAARALTTSGTGLGLAICRRLVEALDGRIAVESTPGTGTNLTVHLPIWDEASKNDPAEDPQRPEGTGVRHGEC